MTIVCPQCGNPAHHFLQTQDYNRRITTQSFSYYRCTTCTLIFLSPVPENLRDYYPQSYYPLPTTIEEFAPQVEPQRYKINLVKQHITKGKLLEIGSGPGDFALMSKQAGFEVDVIEMDEASCRFLRDVIGVNAINTADTVAALKTLDTYDVIAMWQVIEHLTDPWQLLDEIGHHINPGGILVISAPNPDGIQFSLFRRWWAHLDAPRHLSLIPLKLLIQHLGQSGWAPVMTTSEDLSGWMYNRFGWRRSFRNLLGERLPTDFFGNVANRLIKRVERRDQNGSTYISVFKYQLPSG